MFERDWQIAIPKIEAGAKNGASLLIVNSGEALTEFKLPSVAEVNVLGESGTKRIPLHSTLYSGPLSQFPASVYAK
jgi:hypothetical protein